MKKRKVTEDRVIAALNRTRISPNARHDIRNALFPPPRKVWVALSKDGLVINAVSVAVNRDPALEYIEFEEVMK